MAIQLYIQATILLASYYHFETLPYAEIQARSALAGYGTLPFMPPETVRATPELVALARTSDPTALADFVVRKYGYKPLVNYYIRTGLRASQIICRNYLLNLDEKNQYLEFLRKEFGVAYGVAAAVLAAVNANGTLTSAFMISNAAINQGVDIYRDYRFLSIDREAARVAVEAAQNMYAEHFMKLVNQASANSTNAAGGYTFSDALNAVSTIEYQCTREGINHLLNRSINNTPSNMAIDARTGTIIFSSTQANTAPAPNFVPMVPAAPPLMPATTPQPSRSSTSLDSGGGVRSQQQAARTTTTGPTTEPTPTSTKLSQLQTDIQILIFPRGTLNDPDPEVAAYVKSLFKPNDANIDFRNLIEGAEFAAVRPQLRTCLNNRTMAPCPEGSLRIVAAPSTAITDQKRQDILWAYICPPGGSSCTIDFDHRKKLENLLPQTLRPQLTKLIKEPGRESVRQKLFNDACNSRVLDQATCMSQ